MNNLQTILNAIKQLDHTLEPDVQAHLNDLTKPQGSLGQLEKLAMQYCLIHGTTKPAMGVRRLYCFAGDHGVAAEGVSAFPQAVTPQMVMNMLGGGAAINVLTRHAGAELHVVDIGVNAPLDDAAGLISRRIKNGTHNFVHGPAMSASEAEAAIMVGVELAQQAKQEGVTLLGTGEMGIANTTPATALFAAYMGQPPKTLTGRGTGVNDAMLQHKAEVIQRALDVNRASLDDPFNTLAALGGLEIAGICGLCLGGALTGVPVAVDGFISTAGATAAVAIKPEVRDYLIFSHASHEQGHRRVLEYLNAQPVMDLEMRLGEGTGAALTFTVIEAALKLYNEMATFSAAGVSNEEPDPH